MPANITPSKQFYFDFGDLRKHELVPTFVNHDPSPTDVRLALFSWLLFDVSSPGTLLHETYARTTPIELPRTVIGPALGVGPGIVRELVDLRYGICEGILNIVGFRGNNNKRLLILKPTVREVERLMAWRREREIEAALSVHRTDELGAKARSSSRQGLKRTLAKSLPGIVELMCEANAAIDSGSLSELDRRIKAEMFWQADIYVREKIFDAAEMACERASARRVREKLRLIGCYDDVVIRRATKSVNELRAIVDSVLSICDDERQTSQRVIDAVAENIDQETEHLTSLLKLQGDANQDDTT